jgi:thiamine kinase-like enzyme
MIERRLGEAETSEEHAVEAAIARVPLFAGKAARYARIVGGISNSNWRIAIEDDARRYFLKIPGAGTEMFVDRLAANEAARLAHGLGLGPEVVHFDETDGLEVAELLEGYAACTNAEFQKPDIQHAAVGCYRRFHEGAALGLTKTIFDMIDEHIEQVAELGGSRPEDWPFLSRLYENARAAFLASGLDLVPCFNDPMPGNFLVKPGAPMKLVDYEFASMNERSYELGVWLGEMFFPEETAAALIEAYAGERRPDFVARVIVMRALADVKWATWAMVQEQISLLDFDFHKYGAWKYMRARSIMHDPRWERWLRSI